MKDFFLQVSCKMRKIIRSFPAVWQCQLIKNVLKVTNKIIEVNQLFMTL